MAPGKRACGARRHPGHRLGAGGVFSSNTHLASLPRLSFRGSAALTRQLPRKTADTRQPGGRSSHKAVKLSPQGSASPSEETA